MKRTTKILGSTTGLLAAAAFAGLISGSATHAAASTFGVKATAAKMTVTAQAGAQARHLDDATAGTHDCAGKNSCSGQGGCKTGDQGCKGKNSCKGKGGCKTNGSL